MIDELDKFKDVWQALSQSNLNKNYSREELNKIVRRQSRNEIAKIRRKFMLEGSLSLFLAGIFVAFVGYFDTSILIYAIGLIVILLVVGLLPNIKMLRRKTVPQQNLKQYLEDYIQSFEKLISRYVQMIVYLIPLAACGAYIIGFYLGLTHSSEFRKPGFYDYTFGIAIVAGLTALGYALLKRYYHWIYGKNMARLKQCLTDLE